MNFQTSFGMQESGNINLNIGVKINTLDNLPKKKGHPFSKGINNIWRTQTLGWKKHVKGTVSVNMSQLPYQWPLQIFKQNFELPFLSFQREWYEAI